MASLSIVSLICLLLCLSAIRFSAAFTITTIGSTIPSNGDLNPYGVAVIKEDFSSYGSSYSGYLSRGDVLVSNFNNADNMQGTGTTIVRFPGGNGPAVLFAQINPNDVRCEGGIGLTTALVVLKGGWVIVGSLPTTNGSFVTAAPGCLIVLNARGDVVKSFNHHMIRGPWDATLYESECEELLFVSNVLNGDVTQGPIHTVNKGTVIRIKLERDFYGGGAPRIASVRKVGSGFGERADNAALIIGPTGLGLRGERLYVADTLNNRISEIPDALDRWDTAFTGKDLTANGFLNSPLGLLFHKGRGTVFSANAADSLIVETSVTGDQLRFFDTGVGGGGLFGIATTLDGAGIYFVDDNTNTLKLLNLNIF